MTSGGEARPAATIRARQVSVSGALTAVAAAVARARATAVRAFLDAVDFREQVGDQPIPWSGSVGTSRRTPD